MTLRDKPLACTIKATSESCKQALDLTSDALKAFSNPSICEIGIGVGATSLELCRTLNHAGEIWFFDFDDRLQTLTEKLLGEGFSNFRAIGNSRKVFDSYSWNLAVLLRQRRARKEGPLFDFIYLNGSHTFDHDAPATLCAKELLKVGGTLLMDGYDWTIALSPTMRPSRSPSVLNQYSDEQIELSHVEMVCSLFIDADENFERMAIGYNRHERRRAYRKIA